MTEIEQPILKVLSNMSVRLARIERRVRASRREDQSQTSARLDSLTAEIASLRDMVDAVHAYIMPTEGRA
jgi:hypothetical protein